LCDKAGERTAEKSEWKRRGGGGGNFIYEEEEERAKETGVTGKNEKKQYKGYFLVDFL
jgi:hypothetical protein